MHFLFLDDCYRKESKYLGYGGFCIDESNIRNLTGDFDALKEREDIPQKVELKWSPEPGHYLRRHYGGQRQELYKNVISLLHKHDATVICAVHDLRECYGVRLYGWDLKRTLMWAAKKQFQYIAERFEEPYLAQVNEPGLVVADHYSERKGDVAILKDFSFVMAFGTEFRRFENICMVPMMTFSQYCPPIQIADIVTGVIVGALDGSRYALDLFDDLGLLFLKNPQEGVQSFVSSYSKSVLGFGLILFPRNFQRKGGDLFKVLDKKYIYTNEGTRER